MLPTKHYKDKDTIDTVFEITHSNLASRTFFCEGIFPSISFTINFLSIRNFPLNSVVTVTNY